MLLSPILLALLTFGRNPEITLTPHCYRISVDTVVLGGRYVPETHFGAPGFGENPSTDARVSVPMLRLRRPLRVCNLPGVRVTKVQLALPGSGWAPPDPVHEIHVSGVLIQPGGAPGVFAPVLMNVHHITGLRSYAAHSSRSE